MRAILCIILFFSLLINISLANELPYVYIKDNNLYIRYADSDERQLTSQNKDYNPVLSSDGQRIIFIREIKFCPITPSTGWVPGDYDEIWSMSVNGGDQRSIIKNNYSENVDMKNYLGSFGDLHISTDSKKIYFLCQNCATDAILYIADIDGSNVRRVCNAHQLDLVGGNPDHKYYGYLVIGQRQSSKDRIKWVSVLLDTNGGVVEEIEDIDQFWQEYEKL